LNFSCDHNGWDSLHVGSCLIRALESLLEFSYLHDCNTVILVRFSFPKRGTR
jgi:hypothetical protein